MPDEAKNLAGTIQAIRPVLPAKDFETSKRFYADLGFEQRTLSDGLVEIRLGTHSFLLQGYYVELRASNFVMHLLVSEVNAWWEHIVALDLASRYGVKTTAPRDERWGLVAGIVDPSGVLWRIVEIPEGTARARD